jgi:tetratricopeptide (TPR) repeat protein
MYNQTNGEEREIRMATKTKTLDNGGQIEWVGPLSKTPFGEVLKRIAAEERSGDLQVIYRRTIKTIYFDRGFVVFAASNLKRDRLGESLIDAGRISRHEFAMASELMKKDRRKFGQALVETGVMSEEELGRQVATQVNRILLSLFKVDDGIYSFDERPTIIPVELMVSLSIYRILLDGIRRMTDEDLILRNLPSMKTRLRVSTRPPFTVSFNHLNPTERDVLRSAVKGASLRSILATISHERGATLRACYGLYAAGLLEMGESETTTRPLKVQEETGSFLLSEIQQKFARIRATNTRQEILMEYDRLGQVAEPDLLKINQKADPDEVTKAYEEQNRKWGKKKNLVSNEVSMVVKVDEIQARLEKAYRKMLSDQDSPESETLPHEDEGARPGEAVLTKPSAPSESDAPTSLPPLNEDLIEEISFDPLPEPRQIPPDTQPELKDKSPALDGVDTQPPAGAETLEDARVRQLLRDANMHFQVQDWEGVISLLYELAEIAPNNASYHGMLAKAMARHPVMRRNAERHFIEALRIEPQSEDLHFSLALYYESFGLRSRADTEFRTVLRINPSHEGARKRFIDELKRKDPLKDMFRKIFG